MMLTPVSLARLARLCLAGLGAGVVGVALAAPGAHGPGGEHLDAPAGAAATAQALPRLEAATDVFEIVATLHGGELSLLIDRYASNEPVLGAQVQVESGGVSATATFHADHGDYAVDDADLLKRLAQPGEHALVITVTAGDDADLLNGSLTVGAHAEADDDHGHAEDSDALEIAAFSGLALLAAAGGWWAWRRRNQPTHASKGAQR
jgi:hypothetical protein